MTPQEAIDKLRGTWFDKTFSPISLKEREEIADWIESIIHGGQIIIVSKQDYADQFKGGLLKAKAVAPMHRHEGDSSGWAQGYNCAVSDFLHNIQQEIEK